MTDASAPPPIISPADVLAIAADLAAAPSLTELRDRMLRGLTPFGFIGFTFAAVRRVKSVYLHAEIAATWPRSGQTSFQQSHLFNADPVIIRSRTATAPFVWDFTLYDPANEVHAELLALRRANGSRGGVCIPVPEAWTGRSVLYLSGTSFDASERTLLAMRLLTGHFAACAYAIGVSEERSGRGVSGNLETGDLSQRERQVFGWLAFGKTSWDVSVIMGISEHTVNEYIASGIAKLKASNRTEAVLRALLTNQIDLS
jgi:DNA-binding CsgD family transcriptional regulator